MVLQLDIHMQKNKSRCRSCTIHRNYLKIDHRPQCKTPTIKPIEDNIGKKIFGEVLPLDTIEKTGNMKDS